MSSSDLNLRANEQHWMSIANHLVVCYTLRNRLPETELASGLVQTLGASELRINHVNFLGSCNMHNLKSTAWDSPCSMV